MARAALNWTTSDLAKAAGIGINTVNRFEGGSDTRLSSVNKLRSALEDAGIAFIAENGGGAGVRLKKAERRAERRSRR
jgi:transcriptional regulator with XRE-family HTH domain